VVGVLRTISGSPSWHHALGTLFDLANRGIVAIDEMADQKWYQGKDFRIRLLERPTGLWPHEQALLDLLFEDNKGNRLDSIRLSQLSSNVTISRWKTFSESLKAELKSADLWSKEREVTRKKFFIIGIVCLILMVVGVPLIVILVDQTAVWSLVLLLALALVSIAWIIVGSIIPVWSETGAAMAADWEPFYRYIRQVGRGKVARGQMNEFEQYLPYAAAYGQLDPWVKRFKKEGWTAPPTYFHALKGAGTDSMALFVVMAHSVGSSGSSAAVAGGAGAAGGGAAGGGASGAG
jgi:uncharacterized membrane protein